MNLRERLEAKRRRRLVVPIMVSDPVEDHRDLTGVLHALELAKQREADDTELGALQGQVVELSEKVQSHWVEVELQSLPHGQWEIAATNWQTIEVNEDGPTAVMDWGEALAPLLAEMCTDESLKDPEWWAAELVKDHWSEGDIDALRGAVLRLNVEAAQSQAPKG